jgi:hypothetical protein
MAGADTGASAAANGGGSALPVRLRCRLTSHPSIPCSLWEMPAPDPMRPASDATTFENRAWPCSKIRVLTSLCEHDSAMRTRSCPDPAAQSASQTCTASSAIKPATDTGAPSASAASRAKARTSSTRAGSSTSCSSEKRLGDGAVTMQNGPLSIETRMPFYGSVMNEV